MDREKSMAADVNMPHDIDIDRIIFLLREDYHGQAALTQYAGPYILEDRQLDSGRRTFEMWLQVYRLFKCRHDVVSRVINLFKDDVPWASVSQESVLLCDRRVTRITFRWTVFGDAGMSPSRH